jgi:hypothetical protein
MKEYDTVSRISAAPETIWKILTDAPGYASWNPEIVGIEGRLSANARAPNSTCACAWPDHSAG